MNYTLTQQLSLVVLLVASFAHANEQKDKPSRALACATYIADRPVLNLGLAATLGAAACAGSHAIINRAGHGKWATQLAYIGTQWLFGHAWDQINRQPLHAKNKAAYYKAEELFGESLARRSGPAMQIAAATLAHGLLANKFTKNSWIIPTAAAAYFIPKVGNCNMRNVQQGLTILPVTLVAQKIGGTKLENAVGNIMAKIDGVLLPGYQDF